jgi:hypothetical protein
MTERSIIFSGPMVRALLNGKKTQTRRIVKPAEAQNAISVHSHRNQCEFEFTLQRCGNSGIILKCPYGKPGDRLWVKETHRYWWQHKPSIDIYTYMCRYKATDTVVELPIEWGEGGQFPSPCDVGLDKEPDRWRSPIYMHRFASRITPEITRIRVERLQDISAPDMLPAKGRHPQTSLPHPPWERLANLPCKPTSTSLACYQSP